MSDQSSPNVVWQSGHIGRDDRLSRGATLWFTGLSGSGKSTIAVAVEAALIASGRPAYLLDGDNVRHGLNGDLGFSDDDRRENVRRVAHVASILADAGVVALVPVISPFRAGRDEARQIHAKAGLPFHEVWVSTPLELCEQRDTKGLYAKARRGELSGMTGIDSAYEEPLAPELEVATQSTSVQSAVEAVLALVR